jgi:hypothetical protein
MHNYSNNSMIPLARAVLCLDCNCVTDANRECPACSSKALMNLSSVLDRREMFCHAAKHMIDRAA